MFFNSSFLIHTYIHKFFGAFFAKLDFKGFYVVFSDNNDHSCSRIQLPTTVEHLIELVGENGDGYEDKIRSHKNELHPALW